MTNLVMAGSVERQTRNTHVTFNSLDDGAFLLRCFYYALTFDDKQHKRIRRSLERFIQKSDSIPSLRVRNCLDCFVNCD